MTFEEQVSAGERFEFGANWERFLVALNPDRVREAATALDRLLGSAELKGRRFLDVGSGSGLSSLAARNAGAHVCSFDYDPQSVGCTRELRRRFHPDCESWEVFQGSALDRSFLASLGRFDVVYSWGVLHHTGKMWDALGAVAERVKPGGLLAVAIYNDQGLRSRLWLKVKQIYCSGILGRFAVCFLFMPYFAATGLGYDLLVRQNPLARYRRHTARGMSVTRDWFDWLGGLPFEVAKPEQIFRFYRERGFELLDFTSVAGRVGCNEFLFRRTVDVQKK